MKLKLSVEDARNAVWDDHEDFEPVEEKIVDTSRWSIHYEKIMKHVPSGKLFRAYYSRGATECQEERPFEYEDEVEFVEVRAYDEPTIIYLEVRDE